MLYKIRLSFIMLSMVAIAIFFAFGFSIEAEAAARTASVDGNWTDTATWGGQPVPVTGDDVTINTDIVVIVNTDVEASSISIDDPEEAANGITVETGGSITLTGALTFVGSIGTAHSTVAVADGELTVGSIAIADGAGTGDSIVSVGTGGTITSSGDITFTGTFSDMHLVATGTGNIVMSGTTGTIGAGGTVSLASGSTVSFTGTGAQTVPVYTYGNMTINKASGTATLAGNITTFSGNLLVTAGTLDTSTHNIDFTGTTTISSGGTLTHGTGTKIHNGNVVIDEGGTWTETGAALVSFLGHVTNNGTFTASTGLHSFLNFTRTINGTFSIPNVSFIGDAEYTNNGILTISTSLEGNGELINGTDATLNIGDDEIDDAEDGLILTASAIGNEVHYTALGAQTVKAVSYYDLNLQGSGVKTIGSGITITNDLSVDSGVTVALTGDSTANKLYLDDTLQFIGSWGSSASDAQYDNNNFFSGTGTVTTAEGTVPSSRSSSGSTQMSREQAKRIWDAYYEKEETSQDDDSSDAQEITTESVAPVNSYAFGTVLVRLGVKGEACMAWQSFLNAKANAGLATDAQCGPLTMAAAKIWQAAQGLVADGLLGPISRDKAKMQ